MLLLQPGLLLLLYSSRSIAIVIMGSCPPHDACYITADDQQIVETLLCKGKSSSVPIGCLTHLPHVQVAVQSPSSPVAAAQSVPDSIPATAVLATNQDGDNSQVTIPRTRHSSPLIMPRLLSFSPGAQTSIVDEDRSRTVCSQARPGSAASVASGKSSLGSALAKYRRAATLRRSSLTGTVSHSSKSSANLRLVTTQSARSSPSSSSSSGRTGYSKGLMSGYGFRPAHVSVAEEPCPTALRHRSPRQDFDDAQLEVRSAAAMWDRMSQASTSAPTVKLSDDGEALSKRKCCFVVWMALTKPAFRIVYNLCRYDVSRLIA